MIMQPHRAPAVLYIPSYPPPYIRMTTMSYCEPVNTPWTWEAIECYQAIHTGVCVGCTKEEVLRFAEDSTLDEMIFTGSEDVMHTICQSVAPFYNLHRGTQRLHGLRPGAVISYRERRLLICKGYAYTWEIKSHNII